jgi:AcrR family transcriptional regulator
MARAPVKKRAAGAHLERVPNVVRRERSREAVLDSAEDLFVRQGYASTTVDQIAGAAGLTKGAIYFHFEDKASVLLSLIERAEKRVIAPLLERLAEERDPAEKIIEYLHYWARIGLEQRETMFLPILMSVYSALGGIIESGQRSRSIQHHAPPREQAAILIAMMDGMLLEWLRRQNKIDGPAIVRGLRGMMFSGLLKPATGRAKKVR